MLPIATLTVNPAVDISVSTQRVMPTRKLRCHDTKRDPGGGGINVARVVKRLGGDVVSIYPAGGSSGSVLTRLIGKEGLNARVIPIADETREDFTVLDEEAREQYRFVLPGPVLRESEWTQCLAAIESANATSGFVCASGSLAPGIPADFYAGFAAGARRTRQRAVLDASGKALEEALKAPLYLIKPNLQELSELVGAELGTEADQLTACRSLIGRGMVEMIALTLGADGALLVAKERALRARCAPMTPVSAVGAGDSFTGGMLWALASDMELSEALRYGVAAGTAAILAKGTELCRAADVHRLLQHIVVTDISPSA
jgi:6-phosphofructokinase 2